MLNVQTKSLLRQRPRWIPSLSGLKWVTYCRRIGYSGTWTRRDNDYPSYSYPQLCCTWPDQSKGCSPFSSCPLGRSTPRCYSDCTHLPACVSMSPRKFWSPEATNSERTWHHLGRQICFLYSRLLDASLLKDEEGLLKCPILIKSRTII